MRYSEPLVRVLSELRGARLQKGMSQAALAEASGAGRVTIARIEAGTEQDFRIGTLARICSALGLELAAVPTNPPASQPNHEPALARERVRAQRLDARRRHAALAAGLLALPSAEAESLIRQAIANVGGWERDRLCSEHFVARWRERLEGPVRTVALRLLEHREWTDALLQNTPWGFALEPEAE